MEVRIGVVHTPKELDARARRRPTRSSPSIEKPRSRANGDAVAHRRQGPHGRRPDRQASPTSRSTEDGRKRGRLRPAGSSAHDGPGARPPRPPPAVLHREGRGRQEHGHRGDRAARGRARQARAARRGRRQGQPHRALRARARSASSPGGATPASTRCRWTPRRRCASTSAATCGSRCSAASARSRGALDFVATAAPGVKEILTVGKVCWEVRESIEGRADWDLVVVDAAATGHVIASSTRRGAIQELVHGRAGPRARPTGWSELLSDPRSPRSTSSRRPRRCRSTRRSSSSHAAASRARRAARRRRS